MFRQNKQYIEDKYRKLYGEKNCINDIERIRAKNTKKYIIVIALFVLIEIIEIMHFAIYVPEGVTLKDGDLISIERSFQGKEIAFPVLVRDEQNKVIGEFNLNVKPYEKNEKKRETNKKYINAGDKNIQEIQQIIKHLNDEKNVRNIVLQNEMEDGSSISWKIAKKNNIILYGIFTLIILIILYKNRYKNIHDLEKEAIDSIISDLPQFISKLVLLLNAGYVMTEAMSKIINDNYKINEGNQDYFYTQLYQINIASIKTNTSLIFELRRFSKRTGVREFMRVINIINDNINKGYELCDKLEREGELLWFNKKKRAEELGKIAETKMTFPLVLLLLVLIMITTVPAMMEMN